MKLRIQAESITLRILPEETEQLLIDHRLEQRTQLVDHHISIILEVVNGDEPELRIDQQAFHFFLPKHELEEWKNARFKSCHRQYSTYLLSIEEDLPRKKKQP